MSSCKHFEDALVNLAFGNLEPDAESHALGCSNCSRELDRLRTLVRAGQLQMYEPPSAIVDRAKMILSGERTSVAAQVRSTLAFAGVRDQFPETFQVVYEAEELNVRVSYSLRDEGWFVQGSLSEDGWSVHHLGKELDMESARFHFTAENLDESTFRVQRDDVVVIVPGPLN